MFRPLALLLALGALGGCWRSEVVRVVEGVEIPGRFVTDRAYASYLIAAEWEARGLKDKALEWYRDAARWDGDSPEIWTRIGALSCQQAGADDDAEEAFARAEALDPDYEPLWRERARCAELQGQTEPALAAARRAAALDPGREDTVLLLVELLHQGASSEQGRLEEAARWLRDLTVRQPDSVRLWMAVGVHAATTEDAAWGHEAERRLTLLRERHGHERAPTEEAKPSAWAAVDRALLAGSLDEARSKLRGAHLDSRLLAARALAVGRAELAREEAALRAAADPQDGDAQVALALASDLLGERALTVQALGSLAQSARHLGGTARWLFAELLWRRGGPEAARLWLGDEGERIAGLAGLRAALRASFE